MSALIQLLRAGTLLEIRAAVKADPQAARHPRAVVAAGQRALQPALAVLLDAGADLNAVWRNYRLVYALLQEDRHAGVRKPSPERLACLEWMLAHGADPEQLGAWPSARAIIVAAFIGSPEYVAVLRKGGAKIDGFVGAALGDLKRVETALAADPEFVRARDHGGLTTLQCAAGSRLPKAATLHVARRLIDAGGGVSVLTKSWCHEVAAAYFAAGAKHLGIFELLLRHGADLTAALAQGAVIDRATADGKPLLNHLVCWGQIPQPPWLLERKASPNVADPRGWTAVHQAASRGNVRLLSAVLDAGGDATRRDLAGNLPRDVTQSEKLAEMLKR